MALRGNLKDFTLPDVFQLIAASKKTGVLRIGGAEGAEGSVWFRDGDVFFAQSNWHHEKLGDRLVGAHKITPSALARALEMRHAEPAGRRIGQILVDEGYITQAVLEAFVQEQIQDTIFDLMRWDDGEFDFEILPQVVDEDIGLTVSIENIVMEGSRRLEEWARIKKKVPSMDIIFRMATAPGEGAYEISLKPVEWNLLLLIDGTRTVSELARATGRTDFEVARIVYGLFSAGLLEVTPEDEARRLQAERDERIARHAAEMPAAPEITEAPVVETAAEPAVRAVPPLPEEAPSAPEPVPHPIGAETAVEPEIVAATSPVEVPEFLAAPPSAPAPEDMAVFEEMVGVLFEESITVRSAEIVEVAEPGESLEAVQVQEGVEAIDEAALVETEAPFEITTPPEVGAPGEVAEPALEAEVADLGVSTAEEGEAAGEVAEVMVEPMSPEPVFVEPSEVAEAYVEPAAEPRTPFEATGEPTIEAVPEEAQAAAEIEEAAETQELPDAWAATEPPEEIIAQEPVPQHEELWEQPAVAPMSVLEELGIVEPAAPAAAEVGEVESSEGGAPEAAAEEMVALEATEEAEIEGVPEEWEIEPEPVAEQVPEARTSVDEELESEILAELGIGGAGQGLDEVEVLPVTAGESDMPPGPEAGHPAESEGTPETAAAEFWEEQPPSPEGESAVDVRLAGAISDEISALTGAQRARPTAVVSRLEAEGRALKRDTTVDKATLLKIIEGIEKL